MLDCVEKIRFTGTRNGAVGADEEEGAAGDEDVDEGARSDETVGRCLRDAAGV
ncbi:hypothetical protein GCM10009655_06480 [Rhodoglobus aureus]|uniref:Uncharacterized protein n=1 Tax=Rhodoglobus aureus TaxID=191497 RepID=A0ABN1VG80_9MICO